MLFCFMFVKGVAVHFSPLFLLLLEGNVSGCKDQETPNGGFEQRFERASK